MAGERENNAREALAKLRRFLRSRWEEGDPALFLAVASTSARAGLSPAAKPASPGGPDAPRVPYQARAARTGPTPAPAAERRAPAWNSPPPSQPPVTAPSRGVTPPPGLDESGLINPAASERGKALLEMYAKTRDCTRCPLGSGRKKFVFGTGNPEAEVVFVGEAPGEQEDLQGFPFVGPAGKLLTTMLEAVGIHREKVFICNVLKCRPPGNRPPELPEIEECEPYLFEQIRAIKPKVIVALGRYAAQSLLQTKKTIGQVKSRWYRILDADLIATYHPSACLRYPPNKKVVEADLLVLKARLDQLKVRT